jgi:hypothetical protein
MRASVAAEFARAGLTLVVERSPIEAMRFARVEIVQIDIARVHGAEWFRVFPGAPSNEIDVADADASIRQLVMTVTEGRRSFEARVGDDVVERFTRGVPQHYLCGKDESHLFIAHLPRRAGSVKQAHALLAPVVPADYSTRSSIRQGEWFFLPAIETDLTELARIEVLGYGLRTNAGIAETARWRRPGRPHVASAIRVLKGTSTDPGRRVFVRGEVRHPDHRTLLLRDWHRVLPNGELPNARGIRWVD